MMNKINVTQPYLPPLEEFLPYLEKIWKSKILTNGGPYHQELESELCNYLGVPFVSLFANGTLALITALQALNIKGEVITTPYSFVATSHSLLWNGIKPVFVDVLEKSLNIDPDKIESAITSETSAILAVHCYGNLCNVNKIYDIAQKNNLKVIYDACHSFGIKDKHGSVLTYGDLSILSFHATKVFNTFEGGAIVCKDYETKIKIDNLKNFGFKDEVTVIEAGINGKMSEINAAFGLLQLTKIDEVIYKRSLIDNVYRKNLSNIKGIECFESDDLAKRNYTYFPIFVKNDYGLKRDELYERLKNHGIYARRYFYPLISEFGMYNKLESSSKNNLPVAKLASEEILCLPIYPDLDMKNVELICSYIFEWRK